MIIFKITDELVTRFLSQYKESTRKTYRSFISVYLTDFRIDTKMKEKTEMEQYLVWLKGRGPLSPQISALRSLLMFLMVEKVFEVQELQGLFLILDMYFARVPFVPERVEIEALIAAVDSSGSGFVARRDRLIVHLLLSGVRAGELVYLRCCDFTFPILRLKDREIKLEMNIACLLREYLASRGQGLGFLITKKNGIDPLRLSAICMRVREYSRLSPSLIRSFLIFDLLGRGINPASVVGAFVEDEG